jgi:hypothetical protein
MVPTGKDIVDGSGPQAVKAIAPGYLQGGDGTMMRSLRRLAAVVLAASSLPLLGAPIAQATPVHCVDATRLVSCYELVWVDGVQRTMTFPQAGVPVDRVPSTSVQNFYVMAPQTSEPQADLPFLHDHSIAGLPRDGGHTVFLHGYFVACSAEGLSSGACVATISEIPGFGTVPLAMTVSGEELTSTEVIESGVDAGLLTLIDTGAVFIGVANPNK